jgi:hypothetical protein
MPSHEETKNTWFDKLTMSAYPLVLSLSKDVSFVSSVAS